MGGRIARTDRGRRTDADIRVEDSTLTWGYSNPKRRIGVVPVGASAAEGFQFADLRVKVRNANRRAEEERRKRAEMAAKYGQPQQFSYNHICELAVSQGHEKTGSPMTGVHGVETVIRSKWM